jgi:Polysaccharide deacetylase
MPAICLFFWDYDTQWGADRSRSDGGAKKWGSLDFENTERLLELHADHGIPACFAIVAAAGLPGSRPYHDPEQIRRIHAAGHEIASHSLYHEWLPGLDWRSLVETVSRSKDALEQCTGSEVVTFVPPFNQPFDYPRGWSFSLSERRETNGERTDLTKLCDALKESGYRFCRVAYRPLPIRLLERLCKLRPERPSRLEQIAGITCVRLKGEAGFGPPTIRMLEHSAEVGGLVVIYGHPHSLHAGNSQDETYLRPFLGRVQSLTRQGLIRVGLPREFVQSV